MRRHWKGLLVAGAVVVALLAVGVPYAYIHLLSGPAPKPLSLSDAPTGAAAPAPSTDPDAPATSGSPAPAVSTTAGTASAAVSDLSGTWKVGSGSQAGYRVKETLVGQHTTAVGRTSQVSGSLRVAGTAVTQGEFTVQMATVTSDRSERDGKFVGPIMDTSRYPTGTFQLTKPIQLGTLPAVGATITAKATGKLTLRGVTKPVTITVQAQRRASNIAVTGDIPIRYQDYGIDNPSVGGFVSVGDSGTIEFLLVLTKS